MKNEAFFPQQNSPVERFKPEPFFYQNGFHPSGSPIRHFLDDLAGSTPISIPNGILSNPNLTSPTDIFSLKLKLELDNYIHTCQNGEEYREFREESPASSRTGSTSSLLSLVPTTGGAPSSSPSRRHSFSAAVTNSQSTSCLRSQFGVIGRDAGGAGGTASSSGPFRQRSHTYSSSSSKPHPYPLIRRLGWQSSASSSSQVICVLTAV